MKLKISVAVLVFMVFTMTGWSRIRIMPIQELVERSDLIIKGVFQTRQDTGEKNRYRHRLVHNQIQALEVLKGNAEAKQVITVETVTGGSISNSIPEGVEFVAFLRFNEERNVLTVVNFYNGIWRIEDENKVIRGSAETTMDEIKRLIASSTADPAKSQNGD
jgi:hypothetical protein